MIAFFLAFLFCLVAAEEISEEHEGLSKDCSKFFSEPKMQELYALNFLADKELLQDVCPHIISYVECEEPSIVAQNVSMENQEIFVDFKYLIIDLCKEDSRIQKAYLSSLSCFRNGLGMWVSCKEEAQDIYLDYRKFITRDDKGNGYEVDDKRDDEVDDEEDYEEDDDGNYESISPHEPYCITDSYALACMSIQMLKECGSISHETLMEISRRSHAVQSFCFPKDALRLKFDFLEFLTQEEHSNLDIFQSYFLGKKK